MIDYLLNPIHLADGLVKAIEIKDYSKADHEAMQVIDSVQ